MTRYCIAWTNKRKETHTGPCLRHPEYTMKYEKDQKLDKPLNRKQAEAKAERMNSAKEFPSDHWVEKYKETL